SSADIPVGGWGVPSEWAYRAQKTRDPPCLLPRPGNKLSADTGIRQGGAKTMDLNGAVALVTGGNGGLGQRICHALAKEGVHVAVMYARSREQAEGVARELASRHQINAAAFACDITDGAAVENVIGEVIRHFGRLDILVNDAAYNKAIPF